ncbi:hypothetical protein GUH78_00410, partial [Xanthomonas citri pv. citri]|nr:hypothetical protein [Xanthomonas citri pv. citri]
ITRNAIYLREIAGGPSRVAIYGLDGKPKGQLPLPEVAAVDEIEVMDDGGLLVAVKTYLEPPQFLRVEEASGKSTPTKLRQTSP